MVSIKNGKKAATKLFSGLRWLEGRAKELGVICFKIERAVQRIGRTEWWHYEHGIMHRELGQRDDNDQEIAGWRFPGTSLASAGPCSSIRHCLKPTRRLVQSGGGSRRRARWPKPSVWHRFWRSVHEAHIALQVAVEQEQEEATVAYDDWANRITSIGAKIAHKLTKEIEINEYPAADHGSHRPGCPLEVLEQEVASWGHIWSVENGPGDVEIDDALNKVLAGRPRPTLLTGKNVQEAAINFKKSTVTLDGMHPRHIGYVSEECAEVLANIFNMAEATGKRPTEGESMIIALLDKATGGTTPIGWYRPLFRIWDKASKRAWAQWEMESKEGKIFGAGSQKSDDIV